MSEDLDLIDERLAYTWEELGRARASATRSPNSETLRHKLVLAERLDYLLDKRLRLMTADTVVRA